MSSCSVRALWILNPQDSIVFSRRFPVVERRWRSACVRESSDGESVGDLLPTDSELAITFAERNRREGSARGTGIRLGSSNPGSDSWVDDPITRHIITLSMKREEQEREKEFILWPVILHTRGNYYILVLPLVEPQYIKTYQNFCNKNDCGGSVKESENLSSLLLSLPCITGAFTVAHAIGDVITGDVPDPEVLVTSNTGPSMGLGLLDSLTGSIGISARPKPALAPVSSAVGSAASLAGSGSADASKTVTKPIDKDLLRSFISSSMPYGTPIDLNYSNISAIRNTGFGSTDPPPVDIRQPAWKPYLYKGRQRILFSTHETLNAALYDREEIPDSLSLSGQLNCRAELEGVPDISLPLNGFRSNKAEILSFHHCAQVSDEQAVVFSPPLGSFVLVRYSVSRSVDPPVKGFYQLSMVSEDEGAFLFRLKLMEGCNSNNNYYNKSPFLMDFCTVVMPFPMRKIVSYEGTPSVGTAVMSERSIEWRIIQSGRGISGKSIDATFSGTVRFFPRSVQRNVSVNKSALSNLGDIDSDGENDFSSSNGNLEDLLMEKMNRDLQAVDLEEPLCWQAYNYAKVSFKITGGTVSGMTIDPKSVSVYPAVKAPVEYSMQVSSGDYILWNTLGRCPSAVSPNDSF